MAKNTTPSEPFVSQQDRPAIGADTPLSELRVRDLHQILNGVGLGKMTDKLLIQEFGHVKFLREVDKIAKDTHDLPIPNPGIPIPDPVGPLIINQLTVAVSNLTSEIAKLQARNQP